MFFRIIYAESITEEEDDEQKSETYFAKMNIYNSMAHFVAKTLHLRPLQILTEWGVPELLVAYGHYADEITSRNLEEWKALDAAVRNKTKRPQEYQVKFYSVEQVNGE